MSVSLKLDYSFFPSSLEWSNKFSLSTPNPSWILFSFFYFFYFTLKFSLFFGPIVLYISHCISLFEHLFSQSQEAGKFDSTLFKEYVSEAYLLAALGKLVCMTTVLLASHWQGRVWRVYVYVNIINHQYQTQLEVHTEPGPAFRGATFRHFNSAPFSRKPQQTECLSFFQYC